MLWDNRSVCSDIFYFHWLIKILLWPVAGQNNARQERQTENQRDAGSRELVPEQPGLLNRESLSQKKNY